MLGGASTLLPEAALVGGMLAFAALLGLKPGRLPRWLPAAGYVAVTGLALGLGLTHPDPLLRWHRTVLTLLALASAGTVHRHAERAEALTLGMLLLAVTATLSLLGTADHLLWWTIAGLGAVLSVSALLARGAPGKPSLEAGFKYLTGGTVACALTLTGLALLLSRTPGLEVSSVHAGLRHAFAVTHYFPALMMFLLAMLPALLLGLIPFSHLPADHHQAALRSQHPVLAVGLPVAGYSVALRLVTDVFAGRSAAGVWEPVIPFPLGDAIVTGAVLTLVLSAALALTQNHLPRLLGHTSSFHGALAVVGLGTLELRGIQAGWFYLAAFSLSQLGVLSCLEACRRYPEAVTDLRGQGRENPAFGILTSLFLLALAGLPFLAIAQGNFATLQVLLTRRSGLVVAAALAGAGLMVSAAYVRTVLALWEPNRESAPLNATVPGMVAWLCVLGLGVMSGFGQSVFRWAGELLAARGG